jgi:hypothetical protein
MNNPNGEFVSQSRLVAGVDGARDVIGDTLLPFDPPSLEPVT